MKPGGAPEGVSKGLEGSVHAAECADAPLCEGISRTPGKSYGVRSGGLRCKRRPVLGYRTPGGQATKGVMKAGGSPRFVREHTDLSEDSSILLPSGRLEGNIRVRACSVR